MKEIKKQTAETNSLCGCAPCNGRNSCNLCGSYTCNTEHHKYIILRWLLGFLILIMTFWLGAKVGEFKSLYMSGGLDSGYGNHFMMTRAYPHILRTPGQADPATPGTPEPSLTAPTISTENNATPNKTR